ncbi:hypothetical protein GTP38_16505 [Duganella sp. FT94W]|uniref:Addiction module antidote protein n=1 Tax=Duganella lactea TaxID=2692173 RepID=A0ABW9VAN5_9BURK|nr:hypothetical protein [Duganella lactea]MYM35937.1 hypothetical protein [Duganella lactea]
MPDYHPYDFAAALVDAASIKTFLSEALQPGDMRYFSAALTIVGRSTGITELAVKTALPHEQISAALTAPDNLRSATTCAILQAIGLQLHPSSAS